MTAARRTLRAVQALIVGLLVALLTPTTSADAVPLSVVEVHAYVYDDLAVPVQADVGVTERGPPAVTYDNTAAPAVGDHGARGASARPQRSSSWTRTTYDDPVSFVDGDRTIATTPPARGDRGADMRAVLGASVAANTGRTAARACSFSGTTTVLLADGARKPIQDVKVGDRVVATDPETGEQVAKRVEHVFVHNDTVIDLLVDGDVITTTEDHPFWSVSDQRFERADELSPGEKVLGAGGRVITVSGLELGTAREALAYNLSVEGIHTYHVGDAEVLVHNTCPHSPDFGDPSKSPGDGWEWRGPDSPGGSRGAWFNPKTRETLHPDLSHPDPIGPHYDWRDPEGVFWRIYPDGRAVPK